MEDPEKNPNDEPSKEQAFSLSPPSSPVASKKDLRAKLPRFVEMDVDTIRIDPRTEKSLRESGIDHIFAPSSGALTEKTLMELALQEPIQVVRRKGDWWCVTGESLIADAKRILKSPRFLPLVVREDGGKDVLQTIVVVEQMIRPARNQMRPSALKARVSVLLHCAETIRD